MAETRNLNLNPQAEPNQDLWQVGFVLHLADGQQIKLSPGPLAQSKEDADLALSTMAKTVQEAVQGNPALVDLFQLIGIENVQPFMQPLATMPRGLRLLL